MSWLQIGIIGSIVFAMYYFQQIKMTLKDKGYDVELFTGWLTDYRRFKDLILRERDERTKLKYQGILNGLHFALIGILLFTSMLVSGKMK